MPVATHEISLTGIAGSIFWLMLAALVFFVLGYATVGWEKYGSTWIGIWVSCRTTDHVYSDEGNFILSKLHIFGSKCV